MPQTTTTVSYNDSNSQYQLRIPKSQGESLELKDKRVEYTVLSKNSIEIELADEDSVKTSYPVNRSKDGTYRVSMPNGLGDGMGLAGKKVEWVVNGKEKLKITKQEA